MDTSSSSKVTVEYHDPSGIFPLIASDIASRLPLKNLVWRSPNRPLRQIESLHLEFEPDTFTRNGLRPRAEAANSDGTTSFDIVRSGIDPRKDGTKERRHQIPGLQTSPYLKLYILRADDKDAYKATERQKVREWIRDNAAANTKKAKGRSEYHDAFEWVIIHVVVPDTIAASEPRWRESTKDPEELKERKQGMKLPGKSTRTVFDKLRADFNESGKSGQDRVAQIRLTRAQVSADLLPTPAMATTIEETNEEREKTWNDLIMKFRTMILVMFDVRVRQYEADVAEQDSRRAMPGFNYCTFFIYKEGLAMAFESIGLVEDALVIYDELSLGFETALKGIAKSESDGTATTFAPYTVDIIDRIVASKQGKVNGVSPEVHLDARNAQAFQKDYREKIVRSDISAFDFSCYLFARQNALILRLANAKASGFGSRSAHHDGSEDLVLISEVCWRAANFIHNAARSLRQDLYAHRAMQWEKQIEPTLSEADVESLVCSWTYIVAGQMLQETYSPALETVNEPGKRETLPNGGFKHRAVASLGGINAYPQRTTSLPARKSRTSELQGRDSLQSASDSDLMSPPLSPGLDGPRSSSAAPGLIELITYRAELLMMQRKMLELVAKQRSWVAGWALMERSKPMKMEDVDLTWETEAPKPQNDASPTEPSNLLASALEHALRSKEAFYEKYEGLSNKAMRLYISATQSKRAESIMGDLAILKYQQGNYDYAASYFQHVLPFYAEEGWSLMEIEALRMHAMCLKELDRKEEYVVTLLALAAKACGWRKEQKATSSARTSTFDEVADVAGVLPEALAFSQHLDVEVSDSAELYFTDINLGREVIHHDDRDSLSLRLRLRHMLDDEVRFDHISAKLISSHDPSVEIWLTATEVTIERGLNNVTLDSTFSIFGSFVVERVVFQINKVAFLYEPSQGADGAEASAENNSVHGASSDVHQQPKVFLYPHQKAFDAEMRLAKHVQINKPRNLEVHLSSGRNEIDSISLKLRPATAGLRLHMADASYDGISADVNGESRSGQLTLGSLPSKATATVLVPYTLEQAGLEILVHLEATYLNTNSSCTYLSSVKLQTRLPLDVDVNDFFQIGVLFSNFTIRATRHAPVLITNVEYSPSTLYDVESPPVLPMPMTVFEPQPVKLLYKISRTAAASTSASRKDASLMLSLEYSTVEDLVLSAVRQKFAAALAATPCVAFTRLLLPVISERVEGLLSAADVDMAILLRETNVPSYKEVGWESIIADLPHTARQMVSDLLREWHESNRRVTLDMDALSADLQCSIVIPVEVPIVDFVHSASLDLKLQQSRGSHEGPVLLLGQPVKAHLTVTTTTAWGKAGTLDAKSASNGEEGKDFIYDIQPDPDCWLIGGQMRGHFRGTNASKHTFDVLLIPVKLGSLALPHVDIQVARVEGPNDEDDKANADGTVSSETHYASAGRTARVIQASQTSRVFIPESPSTAPRPPSRPGAGSMAKDGG